MSGAIVSEAIVVVNAGSSANSLLSSHNVASMY
jgi:hypothetical protein